MTHSLWPLSYHTDHSILTITTINTMCIIPYIHYSYISMVKRDYVLSARTLTVLWPRCCVYLHSLCVHECLHYLIRDFCPWRKLTTAVLVMVHARYVLHIHTGMYPNLGAHLLIEWSIYYLYCTVYNYILHCSVYILHCKLYSIHELRN